MQKEEGMELWTFVLELKIRAFLANTIVELGCFTLYHILTSFVD